MGSGLANCIKVPAEGFGESGGLSRTFFETGERVAESGDIASEGLRQRGQRRGVGLQCQPGEERARLGRQSRAACVFPTALWTGGKQRWPRANKLTLYGRFPPLTA